MRIALGSTSESKLRATAAVCARAFPGATVQAVDVASAVSAQPASEDETIRGARHRAREARAQSGADLGIGIEGGVHRDRRGTWLCAWAVAVDRAGREGLASGIRFPLPEWIASRALAGEELGTIVDGYLDRPGSHEELGAIGLLTHGLLDRQAALEQALLAALAPFLSAALFAGPARVPGRSRGG
ncbi:MAG TPA: inosine/xanthosine triphosphatase [bacterium]|nr:inosine/xanthosine triphosphatase [bacterium]